MLKCKFPFFFFSLRRDRRFPVQKREKEPAHNVPCDQATEFFRQWRIPLWRENQWKGKMPQVYINGAYAEPWDLVLGRLWLVGDLTAERELVFFFLSFFFYDVRVWLRKGKRWKIEDNWQNGQIDKILHGDREEEMKHGKMRENALKQHSHLQMQTLVSVSLGVSIDTSPMVERASQWKKNHRYRVY